MTRTQRKEFRIKSEVALLTYGGIAGLEHWHRFVAFVRQSLKKWGVRSWGATLEAYETAGLHAHLVLHFTKALDKRTATSFAFEKVLPNVSCGDYLGEGLDRMFLPSCVHGPGRIVWTSGSRSLASQARSLKHPLGLVRLAPAMPRGTRENQE